MEKRAKTLTFLFIILGISVFFRLWQLNQIPPGLYPDEAINGNEAKGALETGNFRVFYPGNNGREGLFINLIALSFRFLGVNALSIRVVSAVIGTFTVLGLYLLTREIFNQATPLPDTYGIGTGQARNKSPRNQMPKASAQSRQEVGIALLASFFLATSFWHTNFSRIGFRAILTPFLLVFCFYFLFRGLRTKKGSNLIISGIFFGLGFYTYTAFRLAVLLLLAFLSYLWLVYRKKGWQKAFRTYVVFLTLTIFIVSLPLVIYFLKNPQDFISRAVGISVFAKENPVKAFIQSLASHLAMFNFYGDPNWRHNFAGSPMLFWPVGIFFLVGLILAIKELLSSIKRKNYSLSTTYYLLLSWFFIMLLPGALTHEGLPHALRVVGVIPPVYIFAGLGGFTIYRVLEKNSHQRILLFFACFLLLLAITFAQFKKYFITWAQRPEVSGAFSENYVKIGNYLNSLPPPVQKYVIVNQSGVLVEGIPMPAQTVMFVETTKFAKPRSTYLLPGELNKIELSMEPLAVIPLVPDEKLFDELDQRFIFGTIEKKEGFWIYSLR